MASLLSTRPAAASIVSRSALLGLLREQPHRGGFKPETDSRSFRSRPKYGAQSPFCSLSVALTVFCRLCFSFPPFLSVPVCLPVRLAVVLIVSPSLSVRLSCRQSLSPSVPSTPSRALPLQAGVRDAPMVSEMALRLLSQGMEAHQKPETSELQG